MTITSLRPAGIAVETHGILPTDTVDQVRALLMPVIGKWAGHSRIRITRLTHVDAARPLVAQLDVGHPHGRLRAQVAAKTLRSAVLTLAARTTAQLRQVPGARVVPTSLATWFPELLPPADRRLSRNKICDLRPTTVDAAIATLERMDYRFHLFREISTAQDSLVCRTGPGSFRLLQLEPRDLAWNGSRPLVKDRTPTLWLTVGEALARLDLTGRPYEFFADKATGRGRIVYARYDGHYAMLSAAVPLWQPN
ncbi:HPF/RaiA family ribosome-associated protein [Kribbella koreensis]|uniref:HPF/RaiA family ribosome-associated protein n=2 Tax=Kribbella TaxID=182639 RepID=A0ABP6YXW3_9ACTN